MTYTFLVEKDVSARSVINAPTTIEECINHLFWNFLLAIFFVLFLCICNFVIFPSVCHLFSGSFFIFFKLFPYFLQFLIFSIPLVLFAFLNNIFPILSINVFWKKTKEHSCTSASSLQCGTLKTKTLKSATARCAAASPTKACA